MARKLRIAAIATLTVTILLAAILGGAYYAALQVRPFYEQALQIEPEVLERGSRELESRATALYSDAKQVGRWQALFTDEQINGWLATQLGENKNWQLPANISDLRVAIARDCLTLGFRYKPGGVDTVVSVDASASITEQGAIAIRFISVRAGALPFPVDVLENLSRELKLPVRWTRHDGKPVALVEIQSAEPVYVDAIQLNEGELYVAGHTETDKGVAPLTHKVADRRGTDASDVALDEYELRLTPTSERSALEIARRQPSHHLDNADSTKR